MPLIQDLALLCQKCGGYAQTKANRIQLLGEIVIDLKILGFCLKTPSDVNREHLFALIAYWRDEPQSVQHIKDKLAILYWWADMVDKGFIFPYGYADYTPDLPVVLTNSAWSMGYDTKLPDPCLTAVLLLMEGFGLQYKEAFVLNVYRAVQDNHLHIDLPDHWGSTKRRVPIISQGQRRLIDEIGKLTKRQPLKPVEVSTSAYLTQLKQAMRVAGMRDMQGLRYAYAQRRYMEMTGLTCPLAGGKPSHFLRPDLRVKDRVARQRIKFEMGLSEAESLSTYLG